MDSWRPWAIGAGAVVGTLLTPVVVPVSLGLIGFGAAGPLAGSLAAGWQASIGSVAAGSLFATAQSVAMGGAVPTIVSALGAGMGAAVAGIASAIADGAADGTSVCWCRCSVHRCRPCWRRHRRCRHWWRRRHRYRHCWHRHPRSRRPPTNPSP